MTVYTYEPSGGGIDTFDVPVGVTSIHVWVYGAKGGSNDGLGGYGTNNVARVEGGFGGLVECDIAVTPGETLDLTIGSAPTDGDAGGGVVGEGGDASGGVGGGIGEPSGGGGCSRIERSGTALVVAGGGGGASPTWAHVVSKQQVVLNYTWTLSRVVGVAGGAGGGGDGGDGTGGATGGGGDGTAGVDGGQCNESVSATGGITYNGGVGGKPGTTSCDSPRPLTIVLDGSGGGGGDPGGGGGGSITYAWSGMSVGSNYGSCGGGGGTSTASGGTGVTMTAGVREGDGKIVIDDAYVPPTTSKWEIGKVRIA